jgi:DNA-binding transcriptional regulator YiaG
MMTPKPIDFTKVEALRKHMLLTTADMAELLGVSRVTYYGWVKGRPIRRSNENAARAMLKRMLAVVTKYGWPTPEAIAANQKQRKQYLLELLKTVE